MSDAKTKMQGGVQWLFGKLEGFNSHKVHYVRPPESTGLISAISAGKEEIDASLDELLTLSTAKEWLFRPEDLVFGGNQIEPRRGDQVIWDRSAVQRMVFEVTPADSEDASRWSDLDGEMIRVHTKLVRVELI